MRASRKLILVTVAVTTLLGAAGCAYTRTVVSEVSDPATTAIRSRFASQDEAFAALDTYLAAVSEVAALYPDPSHVSCLYEYFCDAALRDETVIKNDRTCAKVLRRYAHAAHEAFGDFHSRWFGDVFGWVVYGDSADSRKEEDVLQRATVIDNLMVKRLQAFWDSHPQNPIAITIIRAYEGERGTTCCEEVTIFTDWVITLDLPAQGRAWSGSPWDKIAYACNG